MPALGIAHNANRAESTDLSVEQLVPTWIWMRLCVSFDLSAEKLEHTTCKIDLLLSTSTNGWLLHIVAVGGDGQGLWDDAPRHQKNPFQLHS